MNVHNWQRAGDPGPPYTRFSPNLRLILAALIAMFGGIQNGGYNPRPVRGGSSWSSHAFGAALDWRYGEGPIARQIGILAINWLIRWHRLLGVQVIHDYYGSRVWYADSRGWVSQRAGSHGGAMGTTWAVWLHIETTPSAWANTTPLNDRGVPKPGDTGTVPQQPSTEPTTTPSAKETTVFIITALPTLRRGAVGRHVEIIQALLRSLGWSTLAVDGTFGPLTESAVRSYQTSNRLTVDGIVGTAQTWPALLAVN